MAAMQGDLQTAWELQQQYGYKVDDSTQALIDEAVQTGVVGETHKSTSEQMLDLQKQMTAAVVRLANAIAGPPTSAAGAMDNFAATAKAALDDTSKNAGTTAGDITSSFKGLKFTIPVKYDIPDVPTAPGTKGAASGALVGPYSLEYLAGGGNVLSFIPRASDTVPAMLTPGEGVVNTTGMSLLGVDGLRSLNRGAAPAAGGSTGSVDLSGVHGELKALRSDMRRTQQDLPRAIGIALTDALALLPKRVA
jgi:hypothetical protein